MLSNQLASLLSKYTIPNNNQLIDKHQLPSQQLIEDKSLTQNQVKQQNCKYQLEDYDLQECYDILLNEDCEIFKQHSDNSQSLQTLSWKTIIASQQLTPARQKKCRKQKKQKTQFYNPYYSAQFVEDSWLVMEEAKQSTSSDGQISELIGKLGMKNVKNLGVVRCKKEINNIIEYFETGKLPFQYTHKLQTLINE